MTAQVGAVSFWVVGPPLGAPRACGQIMRRARAVSACSDIDAGGFWGSMQGEVPSPRHNWPLLLLFFLVYSFHTFPLPLLLFLI
jgi:hypothetical protein